MAGSGWIYFYIALTIVSQLALLVEFLAPARVLFRSVALGASALLLVIIPARSGLNHPSRHIALFIMAVTALALLNPEGGSPVASIVHWAFYLAVLAPVFWVMRLDLTEAALRNALTILWVFGTVSSILGILQVYYPGQFDPALSAVIRPERALMIRVSSGAWVLRPMGLTDVPGGAAGSGFDAALFGLCIALTRPFRRAAIAGVVSMIIGVTCIYLSHVRSMLVTLGICSIALLAVLAVSGRVSRVILVSGLVASVAFLGYEVAASLAGDTVTTRFGSLLADNPGTIYRANRGLMLEDAFDELLPKYPFGAGLGRWGMVSVYFGRYDNLLPIEVQWAGWIADGGFPLLVAYPLAVVVAIWAAVRAALRAPTPERAVRAGIVAAHGVSTLALTFSYAVFMSSAGVQFWLLNAILLRSAARPDSDAAGRQPT